MNRLALLVAVAVPTVALAEGPSQRFSVFGHSGGALYLSRHQTAGGVGGGLGVRDTLNDRFLLQADLSYLAMLGNAGRLRVGAGVQRQGTWQPAVLLTGSFFFGDRLTFLTADHPTPVMPPLALGVAVAPLRFRTGTAQVSLLEVGVSVGSDFPGAGVGYSASLLEVSVDL